MKTLTAIALTLALTVPAVAQQTMTSDGNTVCATIEAAVAYDFTVGRAGGGIQPQPPGCFWLPKGSVVRVKGHGANKTIACLEVISIAGPLPSWSGKPDLTAPCQWTLTFDLGFN